MYGIEPTLERLDELKLVVWGEEGVNMKAAPVEAQTHHYQFPGAAQEPDDNGTLSNTIRRWWITDEEPVNVSQVRTVDTAAQIGFVGGCVDIWPGIEVFYPKFFDVVARGENVTVIGRVRGGRVADSSDVTVTVNGQTVPTDNGLFTYDGPATLDDGPHGYFDVTVENGWGRKTESHIPVIADELKSSYVGSLAAKNLQTSEGLYFVSQTPANQTARNTALVCGFTPAADEVRSLLRFPVLIGTPGGIPSGAKIVDARLRLWVSADTAAQPRPVSVSRVTDPAAAGTWQLPAALTANAGEPGEYGDNVGANWINRTAQVAWTTIGGDLDAEDTATVTVKGEADKFVDFNVRPTVAAWAAGAPNQGWLITASEGLFSAYSPDSCNPATRPLLVVRYTRP